MSNTIGLNYRLDIEVLTPLHIGSGNKLSRGFDFEVHGNRTYRLNEQAILNDYWPDDPQQQRLMLSKPLSTLLQPTDYRQRPNYFTYSLSGQPAMREIVECIKDPHGHPYLPGSSLKGAIRTAILRQALAQEGRKLRRSDIGRAHGRRAAQSADDKLDNKVFGPDPNNDLLRALQVGDSQPVSTDDLRLTRVRMVPKLDIDVEAIARGTRLSVPLRVDTYLLTHQSDRLSWPRQNANLVQGFISTCQQAIRGRLEHEYKYHDARKYDAPATAFYVHLIQEFVSGQWPENEFLLQVGYATGWRSKSVLGDAENDDPLLTQIIRDFKLDRGGKRRGGSGGHTAGDPFPKARHLAYIGDKAALPMGWLRLRAVPLKPGKQPMVHRVVSELPEPEPGPPEPLTPPQETPPEPSPPKPPPPPPEEPEESDLTEPPLPPLTPGSYTGTVTYFNLREKRGTVRLDQVGIEIEVRLDQLRKGERYLCKNQRVSLVLVQEGEKIYPKDVGSL